MCSNFVDLYAAVQLSQHNSLKRPVFFPLHILATFVIGALTVATTNFVKKKLYHSVGTPEYFNERIGYKPQKDEYVRISTNSAAADNALLEIGKSTLSDGEKAQKSEKESAK